MFLLQDSRYLSTISNLTISITQEEAGLGLNPERLIISSVLIPQTISPSWAQEGLVKDKMAPYKITSQVTPKVTAATCQFTSQTQRHRLPVRLTIPKPCLFLYTRKFMLRGELLEEFSHEPVNAPSQLVWEQSAMNSTTESTHLS